MVFRSVVEVKDTGGDFGRIEEELALLKKSYVLVGFQKGSTTKSQTKGTRKKKAGLSMPEIAAANEFGTSTIPARPFMATSFDENKKQLDQAIANQYGQILDGKQKVTKSLGLIGQFAVKLIQQKIRAIVFPPNSPRTIAIKGSSKPLIDFGQMVQSVREKVVLKK